MNNIKYSELWKGWRGFIINGIPFESFKSENGYKIIVSPDYNPCARNIVESKGLKSLEKKLNKIDYKIVKPL